MFILFKLNRFSAFGLSYLFFNPSLKISTFCLIQTIFQFNSVTLFSPKDQKSIIEL